MTQNCSLGHLITTEVTMEVTTEVTMEVTMEAASTISDMRVSEGREFGKD
jgi:hypothetical protein